METYKKIVVKRDLTLSEIMILITIASMFGALLLVMLGAVVK